MWLWPTTKMLALPIVANGDERVALGFVVVSDKAYRCVPIPTRGYFEGEIGFTGPRLRSRDTRVV